jgi:hypothetical protein
VFGCLGRQCGQGLVARRRGRRFDSVGWIFLGNVGTGNATVIALVIDQLRTDDDFGHANKYTTGDGWKRTTRITARTADRRSGRAAPREQRTEQESSEPFPHAAFSHVPPLVVDSDAMLVSPLAFERHQVLQCVRGVEHLELSGITAAVQRQAEGRNSPGSG